MDMFLSTKENEIKEIIIKVISGCALPEEISGLQSWIASSRENETYFNEINHAWQVSGVVSPNQRFNEEQAWEKNKALRNSSEKQGKVKKFRLYQALKVAAILIVTFLTGGIVSYYAMRTVVLKNYLGQSSMNEVVAPLGSKSQVQLPDGTIVWLNAGSRLQYSQSYNTGHRNVYLVGEAYFKVKKNPQKPFVVNTSEMKIKAYGTSFNVKAYPEEETITTTLVEGIVKLESTNKMVKKVDISLKPNQNLVYYKSSAVAKDEQKKELKKASKPQDNAEALSQKSTDPVEIEEDVKTDLFTSWKDDNWVIEREELDKLVVMLERRFNTTFICNRDELMKYRVSGIIRKETLEQVLDVLKLTAPIRYTINKGSVILETDQQRTENYSKVIN
jgi:ferric-dicitrate binding protein FerR (iron transport regulator)